LAIDELCGELVPVIDLAHVDLAGGKQRPEQQGRVASLKGLRKRVGRRNLSVHNHDARNVLKCDWLARPDIRADPRR
jgi:hypothetical protein